MFHYGWFDSSRPEAANSLLLRIPECSISICGFVHSGCSFLVSFISSNLEAEVVLNTKCMIPFSYRHRNDWKVVSHVLCFKSIHLWTNEMFILLKNIKKSPMILHVFLFIYALFGDLVSQMKTCTDTWPSKEVSRGDMLHFFVSKGNILISDMNLFLMNLNFACRQNTMESLLSICKNMHKSTNMWNMCINYIIQRNMNRIMLNFFLSLYSS